MSVRQSDTYMRLATGSGTGHISLENRRLQGGSGWSCVAKEKLTSAKSVHVRDAQARAFGRNRRRRQQGPSRCTIDFPATSIRCVLGRSSMCSTFNGQPA